MEPSREADLLAAQLKVALCVVHDDVAAAGYAAGAHAARNNRRVGGHAAANGQDALCVVHALDIFRGGFQTDQNNLLALLAFLGGFLSGEDNLAAGSARGSSQTGADLFCVLERLCVKLWVQQRVELFWIDHADGLFLGDHAQRMGDRHKAHVGEALALLGAARKGQEGVGNDGDSGNAGLFKIGLVNYQP